MQFHEFTDCYSIAKQRKWITNKDPLSIDDFYGMMQDTAVRLQNAFIIRQVYLEAAWHKEDKPYYNVWPAIFEMVAKLKLDIPCSAVQLPDRTFCLRLPKTNNPYTFDGGEIRSIVFGTQEVSTSKGSKELVDGLCLMVDTGEYDTVKDEPVFTFKFFPWLPDKTVDEVSMVLPYHESWYKGVAIPQDIITQAIKLAIVVCMIYDDPEIVTPDILSKDRFAYDEAVKKGDEARIKTIEDRARRRGKNCYDIGRSLEAIPHYRRPHMALFWTGKGRKIAKIQLRKGAVVHRDKLVSVPTGFQSDGS